MTKIKSSGKHTESYYLIASEACPSHFLECKSVKLCTPFFTTLRPSISVLRVFSTRRALSTRFLAHRANVEGTLSCFIYRGERPTWHCLLPGTCTLSHKRAASSTLSDMLTGLDIYSAIFSSSHVTFARHSTKQVKTRYIQCSDTTSFFTTSNSTGPIEGFGPLC